MVKRFLLLLLACSIFAVFLAPLNLSAMELWDPHLRGANEGMAAGALPPPGVYFINNSYFANFNVYDSNADKVPGESLNAYVDVPILLWSTGWEFLGAQYAVGIAQPFDYTDLEVDAPGVETSDNWGLYNTVLIPGILSWSLPHHFYVAGSLSVYLNDGSSTPETQRGSKVFRAWSSNDYYTIEPGIGISWLYDGWNLSADMHFSVPFKDTDSDYLSAPEFWADYTVAKTIKKWTIGVGAYQQNQISSDQVHGVDNGVKASNYGIGPIVGYDFGPIIFSAQFNWAIYTKSDPGGKYFNARFIVPLK